MKVIDLLNKIAKNEEVPKKFKYNNTLFNYDEDIKVYHYNYYSFNYYYDLTDNEVLNDKIEIIEDTPTFKGFKVKDEEIIYKEDKKIEYIEPSETMMENHINIMKKINEIIDHLNVEK